MLMTEAVFMGFILYISGVQGQIDSICALKGSSVDLPCSAQHPTSSKKWFTVAWDGSEFVLNELSAYGNRVTYNMSKESHPTLTISDLRESDAKFYCCSESADKPIICWLKRTELHVADLQVKVIPATEGQKVSLICNTSRPLTENPAAYMWYKNGEFLYEDWSPWYQQLVSSEEAVRYSCAIKGYEHLGAPEVSVDSVTSTCFTVTYTKGRMCSDKQTSVDESCSITYPTEVRVQRIPAMSIVALICNTSCPSIDTQTTYWLSREVQNEGQKLSVSTSRTRSFSCAVKGLDNVHSAEVCVEENSCWSVNYANKRICALEGSSVNISSEYSYPKYQIPKSISWYKIRRSGKEETEERIVDSGRVEYHNHMKNCHVLRINNLMKNDSAEYLIKLQINYREWKQSDFPGVTLIVTGLNVKATPSEEVTEGQRVTLTCSTSCPLSDNTNYIWYFNSRPLTVPERENKHLVLDPVSSQHAGNYSCAVKTQKNMNSIEKTLTVHRAPRKQTAAALAGIAALLVIIPLAVFFWIGKRTSTQLPRTETSDNVEQLNPGPVYANISAKPREQHDLHYERVHFLKKDTDPFYTNVQTHQHQEQEHVLYAVVNFR